MVSFDNTENAFEYKSDKDLKKARFLFKTMSFSSLVKMGHPPHAMGYRSWTSHQ